MHFLHILPVSGRSPHIFSPVAWHVTQTKRLTGSLVAPSVFETRAKFFESRGDGAPFPIEVKKMAKEVLVDGVAYVEKSSSLAEPDVAGLRYCIVRCRGAGVHAGYVKDRDGQSVLLLRSRRLWRWHGKTLSGLATEGTTDASQCKYANEIPEVVLLDACEVIFCTVAGRESIQGMREWVNE